MAAVTAISLPAGLAARARSARSPLVVALALPLLFLHRRYQPSVSLHAGGTTVTAYLSDFAVLAVVLAAAVAARRGGLERLRAGLPLWIAGGAFLAWVLAACAYPLAWDGSYPVGTHLVTALKYCEYALLAPAVALLVRSARDARVVLAAAAAWAVVAAAVGALQLFGAVPGFGGSQAGGRQPSLLGIHDFGALGAAALGLGLAAIALRDPRRLGLAGGIAGGVAVVVAAALDAVVGVALGAAAIGALARARHGLSWKRALALLGVVLAVAGGALSFRGSAIDAFVRFLGIKPETTATREHVQTWSQRVLLAYVGARIFLDHPVLGAGWQASTDARVYQSVLPAARRRFPEQPPEAFPSPQHPWGVQNAPVQLLSDLGIVGFLLAAATVGAGVVLAARAALRGPPAVVPAALAALGFVGAALGVSLGIGLVAGIPLDAVLFVGLGLAAAVAADARRAAR